MEPRVVRERARIQRKPLAAVAGILPVTYRRGAVDDPKSYPAAARARLGRPLRSGYRIQVWRVVRPPIK